MRLLIGYRPTGGQSGADGSTLKAHPVDKTRDSDKKKNRHLIGGLFFFLSRPPSNLKSMNGVDQAASERRVVDYFRRFDLFFLQKVGAAILYFLFFSFRVCVCVCVCVCVRV